MKSDNEEVAASLCLKYGLRLADGQCAKGWALTTFLREAWGSTKEETQGQ
jgi:hypothetical protein